MKAQLFSIVIAVAAGAAATAHAAWPAAPAQHPDAPLQAVCSGDRGEHRLMRATVADSQDPRAIEVRTGSTSRAVDLSDIDSIEVTGPVNRINHLAWATLKTRGGDERRVGIVLRSADGTVALDGVGADGARDTIDLLECKRVVFQPMTRSAGM